MVLSGANLKTTAMGIMPHASSEEALRLALSLDVPFWPQLPNVSIYEDMYIQTSENFPGIELDEESGKLRMNMEKFRKELDSYFSVMEDEGTFSLSEKYSMVFRAFLSKDLSQYFAIRGQVTGPVSFGFKVLDEDLKPIIYSDEVRPILFDFIRRKVNRQYNELKEKNKNAFVWVDEPGFGYVFSGFSGYTDSHAKVEYRDFLSGINGPKGLHLCADVNLPYLVDLGIDILSFDAIQIGSISGEYAEGFKELIERGGVISWGIVPANFSILYSHDVEPYQKMLLDYWEALCDYTKLDVKTVASRSLLAPHRCCLKEISDVPEELNVSNLEEKIVERAFFFLNLLSKKLSDLIFS